MNSATRPEIRKLLAIESPLDRETAARKAIEDARELMESAVLVRAGAIKEMYDVLGATKTARLLGMNRVALYRVIEPVRTAEERERRATKWLMAAEIILSGTNTITNASTEVTNASTQRPPLRALPSSP